MPQIVTPRAGLALALLLAGAAPAAAQGGSSGSTSGNPADNPAGGAAAPRVVYGDGARAPAILVDPETSTTPGMVDESALRYYASQKQTARMKAEIARLRRLYPGWSEPADLDSLQPSPPEEAPLWDLFTAGRFQDLRAAIDARRSVDPAWQPSEELARKLRRAEFRSSVRAAGKNPEAVVALYRADPSALDPADVESIWTIADALAATGAAEDAFNLYKSVLDGSGDAGARLATIQKAMAHIKMDQAERLIAMGRQDRIRGVRIRGVRAPRAVPSSTRSASTSPGRASRPSCTTSRPRPLRWPTSPPSRPMPARAATRARRGCSAGTPTSAASSARRSNGSSRPSPAGATRWWRTASPTPCGNST